MREGKLMPTLQINGKTVTVEAGSTLLAAAQQLDIQIPTLCWREGLEHNTSCMLCVVEDSHSGTLHPACSRLAEDGMDIVTNSETVMMTRRSALELLLSDHLGDCEGPCRRACMAGLNIPLMLRHIANGEHAEAIRVTKQHIALPAVLGRICPAPCENICRRGQHDAPVGICLLKRFAADVDLASPTPYSPRIPSPSGHHVAIVGAGPAGLSAAYALLRNGHACTIFERGKQPGGGLRDPALQDQLPRDVLDREIAQISRLGLTWQYEVTVGETISLDHLASQFDAVILAWGEMSPQQLHAFGLDHGPHGLSFDRRTFATATPNIFACGSAITPGHLTVRATAQAFGAVAAVEQFLLGRPTEGVSKPYDHRIAGKLSPEELAMLLQHASPQPRGIPTDGYNTDEAMQEAARCLHCECRKPDTCLLRKHASAYGADARTWQEPERRQLLVERHGQITYEPGKCIACGICVQMTSTQKESLGLTYIGRGFDLRVGVPFGASIDKAVGQLARECVKACPTGALAHTNPSEEAHA
jgi:NADPH-dependent glutamate synthase beta subunit-like oxidoreductase